MADASCEIRPSRKVKYTDRQVKILNDAYDDGLHTVGAECVPEMQHIANECGITFIQVKTWIMNRRRKSRKSMILSRKPSKLRRTLTSYNLHCAEVFQREELQESTFKEKCQVAADEFSVMPEDKRENLTNSAISLLSPTQVEIKGLSRPGKRELANRNCKAIKVLLDELEQLSYPAFCIVVDNEGKPFREMGNTKAIDCLDDCNVTASKSLAPQEVRDWTKEDVRQLFNAKWAEAGGRGSTPCYSKSHMFVFHGLPIDISFKRPAEYKVAERNTIRDLKNDLQFEMIQPQEQLEELNREKDNAGSSSTTTTSKEV